MPRTRQHRTATYTGGPLDGQTMERAHTRFPAFRDDNGNPVRYAQGCRRFFAFLDGNHHDLYVHRLTGVQDGMVVHGYIHTTVYNDWIRPN